MRSILFVVVGALLLGVSGGSANGDEAGRAVDTGMFAFNNGDFRAAFDSLRVKAEAGDAQAQTRVGEMYEDGLGVPRDFVSAYTWYNVAAAAGSAFARVARDELETRMTPEQVSAAQRAANDIIAARSSVSGASGGADEEMVTVSYTFGSFSGSSIDARTFKTFRSNATADQMVQDILSFNSIPRRSFNVRATYEVPDAAAAVQFSQRYIFYNPKFMRAVEEASSTPWEAYSIMAHEIGHHLAGHTLTATGSQPPTELEADYFSGGTLARMGSTREQAIAAMSRLGSPQGTSTHPARQQRVDAISRGWEEARRKAGSVTPDESTSEAESPRPRLPGIDREEPQQQPGPDRTEVAFPAIARICALGPGQFCPLVVPMPRGSSCTCYGPFGAFPGVAQ